MSGDTPGITIPLSLLLTVGGGLVTAIVFVFKMLISSYEKRISEQAMSQEVRVKMMAERVDQLTEELNAMWRALDRTNHVNTMRMINDQQMLPAFRDDARQINSDIEKESERDTKR